MYSFTVEGTDTETSTSSREPTPFPKAVSMDFSDDYSLIQSIQLEKISQNIENSQRWLNYALLSIKAYGVEDSLSEEWN